MKRIRRHAQRTTQREFILHCQMNAGRFFGAPCFYPFAPLIEMLNDHCVEPEFTCRAHREPGQLTAGPERPR